MSSGTWAVGGNLVEKPPRHADVEDMDGAGEGSGAGGVEADLPGDERSSDISANAFAGGEPRVAVEA